MFWSFFSKVYNLNCHKDWANNAFAEKRKSPFSGLQKRERGSQGDLGEEVTEESQVLLPREDNNKRNKQLSGSGSGVACAFAKSSNK